MKRKRIIWIFLIVVAVAICSVIIYKLVKPKSNVEFLVSEWRKHGEPGGLHIIYPFDSSMFPPEIIAPTFKWEDSTALVNTWFINVSFNDGKKNISSRSELQNWKPDKDQWHKIKANSINKYAEVTIIGINNEDPKKVLSGNSIRISTSRDSVGAPIFYRDVPLPFAFARQHVDSIKWRLCNIASEELAPVVMENLPVCANCHSFSNDGKTIGMDVDALGIKSAYVTTDLKEMTIFSPESFHYWSDFQDGEFTYGLLSQVSPDGSFAISTLKDHEIFVAKPDIEYSNFFFPIKGILAVYDRSTKKYRSLAGADDTTLIQSNPHWSPDGKHIYFARSKAIPTEVSGILRGTQIEDSSKYSAFLNSYLEGKRDLHFDIYRIPFNNGNGGIAEPVTGASDNGMSNYFPKISPDGKWLVFTKAKNFMLLQPDSRLYIKPVDGGETREMKCNTSNMNSWHSWSPNSKWLVFSSKIFGPYTQLFLTHIDENGFDSPPVLIENILPPKRAANIPEFVNISPEMNLTILDSFSKEGNYNLFVRAYFLLTRGDIDEALEVVNFALKKNPEDAETYSYRGRILQQQLDLEGALADFNKSIELKPKQMGVYIDRGNVKYSMKDYNGAISDYNKAILIDPESSRAYFNRGISKYESGKLKEAIDDYSTAINFRPDFIEAYYNRGRGRNQIGDFEGAIEDFTHIIKAKPADVFVYVDRANAKDNSGDFEGAMKDYDLAISLKPNYSKAFLHRGIAKYIHGDYKGAINDYNKALTHDPEFAQVYYNRGIAMIAMDKKNEGCKDLKKSLSMGYNEAQIEIKKNCK